MYPYCLPGVQAANAQTCALRPRAMPPFRGGRPRTSDFEARYDAISAQRSRARRTGRSRPLDPEALCDARLRAIIADRRYLRDLKDARLAQGYAYPGGLLGSEWIGPFSETGLRSERLGFIAKRFVAATARKVESGRRKDGIAAGSSKLLGLDDPYIRLNRAVVSGFRIDVDARFDSFDALYAAVAACRLPALPHLVVGRRDRDGRIHNPHLWYFLPDTGAVWQGGAASARIVALLHRVIAGITAALAPIGADPGGLANPFHGKNPLSPLFSTESWNDSRFPTLADWAGSVDLGARTLPGLAGPAQRGEILHGSNSVARTLFGWAVQTLREAHGRADPDYLAGLADREALGRYLADALRRDAVIHLGWDDEACLQTQCRRIAERWDADRIQRAKNRGVLKRALPPEADRTDRQRAGQAHTAEVRRRQSIAAVGAAIAEARAQGATPSQSGIARATGLARSTVARHWDAALRESLSHSVLRKKGNGLTKPARADRSRGLARRVRTARLVPVPPSSSGTPRLSGNAPSPALSPSDADTTGARHAAIQPLRPSPYFSENPSPPSPLKPGPEDDPTAFKSHNTDRQSAPRPPAPA